MKPLELTVSGNNANYDPFISGAPKCNDPIGLNDNGIISIPAESVTDGISDKNVIRTAKENNIIPSLGSLGFIPGGELKPELFKLADSSKIYERNNPGSVTRLDERELETLGTLGVKRFNQRSTQAQLECGVDPSACMILTEVEGDNRTPLRAYFGALADRKYLIPESGDMRTHDIVHHVTKIRALHPELVNVVAEAARIGLELLVSGDKEGAVASGDALDEFLTNLGGYRGTTLSDLLERMYLGKAEQSEVTDIHRRLFKIQSEHENKIARYFSGVSIDEHR
jgi:hypothetical protein